MIKAIHILAGLVLAIYVVWGAGFAFSMWSLSNQSSMPADKTVEATPITVVITSAILWLIPLVALALGVLAAVAANQRGQKGWRNAFILLTALSAPGPVLGSAFIVGGLFAGGLLYVMIPGLLLVLAPIIMSIVALVHVRGIAAPTPTAFAPAV